MDQHTFCDSAKQMSHLYIALTRMNLVSWMPVFATLVHHIEGLERYISPDEPSPLSQLLLVVTDAEQCASPLRDLLLRRRLARLPFFHYRVALEKIYWNPLREPFADFTRHVKPLVWHDWEPWPPPAIVEQWLKRQLARSKEK